MPLDQYRPTLDHADRHVRFSDGADDVMAQLHVCMCAACQDNTGDRDDAGGTTGSVTGVSAGAEGTLGEMADFLRLGYWNRTDAIFHNVGSTGRDPNNGVLHYNLSGYGDSNYGDPNGVSDARAALIRDAFDVFSAVLGIEFVETTSQDYDVVDFFFTDNDSGAYASSSRWTSGEIVFSTVNISTGWSGGTSTYDDYTLQTIFHEIGHALGLGHQGDYNAGGGGPISYGNSAQYQLDSWQASMMSYFSQTDNTAIDAKREFLQTPMAVDWLALDRIYGDLGYGVDNAFRGDTTYGFNTNISAEESRIWNQYASYAGRTASTIVDGDGIDTLDVSGFGADQVIDLTIQTADQTAQNASNIGGSRGNLTLAIGTVIENAVSGSGNDRLIGNAADNVLRGGGGDDSLIGGGGDDDLDGGAGNDTVIFQMDFASYTVSLLDQAIEIIGEGIDLVRDTVETLQFASASYGFSELAGLLGPADPEATDDTARLAEDAALVIDVLDNDAAPSAETLAVTAVGGTALAPGGSVALASGAVVELLSDGRLSYDTNGAFDALETGQTAQDSFTYTTLASGGGVDVATVAVTIDGQSDPVAPIAPPTLIGQAGTVRTRQAEGEWHDVTFDAVIQDAVVVMGPLTYAGSDASVTRVRNVTDTGFQFQIDEWDYLDGKHTTESVGWLAISEGAHTLSTGQTIVAGTHVTTTTLQEVSFGQSLDDAIVLSEVTTYAGPDAVTTRMRNVGPDGFELRIQEEEAQGGHMDETASWIAIEAGRGAGMEAFRTGTVVDNASDSFAFAEAFDDAPVLLADMQTFRGRDTAGLRMDGLDSEGVSLFVEEEKSRDGEIGHISEDVGIVAFDDGLIFA